MLQELIRTAKNLIYENRCGVCKSPTLKETTVCNACDPRTTLLAHSYLLTPPYCLKCGESLNTDARDICDNCILYPLPIDYIRSIWSYASTTESLICALKYRNSRALAQFLAQVATISIKAGAYPPTARYNWNLILPLPSTSSSLGQRGFSPVAEVVKGLSGSLKLPYSLLSLKTVGKHPLQASLPPIERLKHINGKFRAATKTVTRKHVLLVDDVITSGSSIIGAATCLLDSGATSVDCLSICRSELFSQLREKIYTKI